MKECGARERVAQRGLGAGWSEATTRGRVALAPRSAPPRISRVKHPLNTTEKMASTKLLRCRTRPAARRVATAMRARMRNAFPHDDGKRSTVRACGNNECGCTSKWRSFVSTSPTPAPVRRWHDRPQRILILGERSKPNGRDRRSLARGAARERGPASRAP